MGFMDSMKSRLGFNRDDDEWDDGFDEYDEYDEYDEDPGDAYDEDSEDVADDGYEEDYVEEYADEGDDDYTDEYDLGQHQPGSNRENSVRLVTHDSRPSSYGVSSYGAARSGRYGEHSRYASRSSASSSDAGYRSSYGEGSAGAYRPSSEPHDASYGEATRSSYGDDMRPASSDSVGDEEPSDLSHVVVLSPSSYNEAEPIARTLKSNQAVVLALRDTRPELAKRILDFSFGVASALGCHVEKLDDRVFLITHKPNGLSEGERKYLVELGIIR